MKNNEEESINSLLIDLGLAFFMAQSIEFNLVGLLGMSKKYGKLESEKNAHELMTMYFSKTMGNVKRDVSELISISEELDEMLRVALDSRNWLVHNFYREFGASAFSEKYREKARMSLKKARKIFERTNELISEEIILQGKKCGISEECIDQMRSRGVNNYISNEKEPNDMWDKSLDKLTFRNFDI